MLSRPGWTVHFVSRDLPAPTATRFLPDVRAGDLVSWLDEVGLPDGLPFLLSPWFEYDVALNSYFLHANLTAPWNSNASRARPLARFFTCRHGRRSLDPHSLQAAEQPAEEVVNGQLQNLAISTPDHPCSCEWEGTWRVVGAPPTEPGAIPITTMRHPAAPAAGASVPNPDEGAPATWAP